MKNIDSMRPPRQKRSSSDPSSLAFIVHGLNDSKEEDPSFSDKDSSGPHSKGKQRPRCTAPGCTKTVKSRGKCNSHGGGHRCSEADCLNFAVSHGKCISHGGGKRCVVEGCGQGAKANSLCWKHGGSIRCRVSGCDRGGKTGGLCWAHGGGKLCAEDGCTTIALKGRRCWAHGGGNRCVVKGCSKPRRSHDDRCQVHARDHSFSSGDDASPSSNHNQ